MKNTFPFQRGQRVDIKGRSFLEEHRMDSPSITDKMMEFADCEAFIVELTHVDWAGPDEVAILDIFPDVIWNLDWLEPYDATPDIDVPIQSFDDMF